MNDNMKKGNTVLLTIIAVATLLVAVVGATFAYFTATVQGNSNASSVIVKAQQLATVTYTNNDTVSLTDALPGSTSDAKTFTVAADEKGTSSIKYTLKWKNVSNTFNSNDLVYSLSGSSSNDQNGVVAAQTDTPVPTAEQVIGSGTIKPGATHNYTLTVRLKETGSNQDTLQGKEFSGKIEVTTEDESGSTMYYNASNPSGTSSMPASEESED